MNTPGRQVLLAMSAAVGVIAVSLLPAAAEARGPVLVAGDQVATGPADGNTADGPARRLTIHVTGELLGRPARIAVRGVSRQSDGYRKLVKVTSQRTIGHLPSGRYRVKANVIKHGRRTSAPSWPVQYVTIRRALSARITIHYPPPPRLPRNFSGEGRYIVRDLGIDVPFTWGAKNGEMQMIAGGSGYPIHFTNVIHDHYLYTKTYKWPGLTTHTCELVGRLDRAWFNESFETARYVGPLTLEGRKPRKVNHFRVGWVFPPDLPSGLQYRLGLASADIFVDQKDSKTFWNVQHFGVQNLYDPQLDEWIQMNTFTKKPGAIHFPPKCPRP